VFQLVQNGGWPLCGLLPHRKDEKERARRGKSISPSTKDRFFPTLTKRATRLSDRPTERKSVGKKQIRGSFPIVREKPVQCSQPEPEETAPRGWIGKGGQTSIPRAPPGGGETRPSTGRRERNVAGRGGTGKGGRDLPFDHERDASFFPREGGLLPADGTGYSSGEATFP